MLLLPDSVGTKAGGTFRTLRFTEETPFCGCGKTVKLVHAPLYHHYACLLHLGERAYLARTPALWATSRTA